MIKTKMTTIRGRNPDDLKFMYNCGICGGCFQFGPHVYMGQPIQAWDIMACRGCIRANHDGIVEATHRELVEHIKALGLEIRYYANGHRVAGQSWVTILSESLARAFCGAWPGYSPDDADAFALTFARPGRRGIGTTLDYGGRGHALAAEAVHHGV